MKTQQITRVLEGSSPLVKDLKISKKWKLNSTQGILAKQTGLAVVEEAA